MLTTLGWIMLAFGISLLTAALVMPGTQGLQCFIAGALISIVLNLFRVCYYFTLIKRSKKS